jgi:putative transposase
MSDLQHLDRRRGSVTSLNYHIVLRLKYRRQAISPRVLDILIASLQETCERKGWTLKEANGEADHLHLLLRLPPTVTVSDAVRCLKTNSSRTVRELKLPEITRHLWGKSFWSPSYFAVTCGGATLAVIKEYIRLQSAPK